MLLYPLGTSKSIETNLIHIATQILYTHAGLLRIYNTRTCMKHTMHTFCLTSAANMNYDVIFRACNARYIFITSLLTSAIRDKVYYTRMPLWTIRYRTINVIIHGISLHCHTLLAAAVRRVHSNLSHIQNLQSERLKLSVPSTSLYRVCSIK
jgi:hypothetical protein